MSLPQPTLKKILYVEDDADIREIVRLSLEMIGKYEVATCDSCATALEMLDDFSPDLLLLDVMMPGVDGPATLQALRVRVSAERAPAIFITAKVDAGDMRRYRDMGVVDVIVKPFDTLQLPRQIQQILQRQRNSSNVDGR